MNNKIKKLPFALSAVLLISCVMKTQEEEVPSKALQNEIEVSKNPVENPSFVKGRPVDIAPLVSNYLAARLSESEGRTQDAAFFYDRAESADPQNAALKEHAFMLQLALGNMEESIRLAREIAIQKNAVPISYILLGAQSLKDGDLENAQKSFARAKAISPQLLQFHILEAYIDQAMGVDIDVVMEKLKALPSVAGLNGVRYFHFGRLLEKAGRLEDAQREYEFSVESDSASLFSVLALEGVYERLGQPLKAKALMENFFKKNPENILLLKSADRFEKGLPYVSVDRSLKQDVAGVIFEIATLMTSQKLPMAASQVMNISLMLDEDDDFILFYQGVMQEKVGAYALALDSYSKLNEDAFSWLAAQIRTADILSSQNKTQEAIALIKSVLEKQNHTIVKRILAELYYNKGDYTQAIKWYDDILSLEENVKKDEFWVYFARGTAYERLERYEEAERDLKESIRIMPSNATALNYLGYMWVDRDENIDEAFALIGRAILLKPNDASILDSMGWVLYKKGEYQKAALYLKRAETYRPDDATIQMHLGDVFEKLERYQEANAYWTRALELNPETKKDVAYLKMKLDKSSVKLK